MMNPAAYFAGTVYLRERPFYMPVSVLTAVFFPLARPTSETDEPSWADPKHLSFGLSGPSLKVCQTSRKDMALMVSTRKRAALGILHVSSAQMVKA